MKRARSPECLASFVSAAVLATCAGLSTAATSGGPIIYGSLGNFDVVNDTGQPCNGFEIELEGISPGEVVYTFGDTGGPNPTNYIRYGKPQILPSATGGTIVRYASPFSGGVFTEATPPAPVPVPVTMGHQCWIYGDPNYPNAGCEHFGMSLLKNPTKTTYRWLVGDPATGTLKVAGMPGNPSIPAPVRVPAPIWNVNQPPPPAPGAPPPPPQIVAVVQAPPAPPLPPAGKGQWGEAIWMKIYKTELPEAADLDDMLLGGNPVHNPNVNIVPDAERGDPAEIEWQLLQSRPLDAPPPEQGGPNKEESANGGEVGAGNESVLRRYEFYKYIGQYDPDPENLGEALCDNPLNGDPRCGPPDANGVAGVGDLIGSQNAAANLAPLCATDVSNAIVVKRGGYAFNFTTRLYSQRITLTNTSSTPIYGPISLVLDNLTLTGPNDGLYNLSGKTSCTAPQGSPYIDTTVNSSAAGLAPNATVTLVLQFSNAFKTGIGYTPRVLSTAGSR